MGPWAGFLAALIGGVVARTVKPTELWMFGVIAEPLGVMVCGLLAKRRWRLPIAIYTTMLAAYFIHPLGRQLPLWAIIDILIAFILIYPVTRMFKNSFEKDVKRLPISLAAVSFITTVTDSLTRVFLLIPAGLYTLFAWSPATVQLIFVAGAIDSYVEDLLVIVVSSLVGVPLLVALRRIPGFKYPLT
ncbi:hypothetical protein KEJ39_03715 [Candidatus Bathyarchaeota archaeon]|nr:hypothetical protein [Candidatus Bathyarchaeota archaeon]